MYRQQVYEVLEDIKGAADMYLFLIDEYSQSDFNKFAEYLNDKLNDLAQIEFINKTRQDKPGAFKLPTNEHQQK